jgi:RNA polymerase sigma-B factor
VDLLEAEGDEFDELVTRQALADALAGVSERERLLIRLRFVEERTQSEIGAVLGVSQMEVSRMIRRLLRRLRVELLDPARAA